MRKRSSLAIFFIKAKLQAVFSRLVDYSKVITLLNIDHRKTNRFKSYIIVPVMTVFIVGLLKYGLELLVHQQRSFTYIWAIIFSAWYGGLWGGIVATFSAAFLFDIFDFFFLKPYYTLVQRSLIQSLETVIFLIIGISISLFIEVMYSAIRSERKSTKLIQHIMESITDAFIIFDRQFRVAYINSAAGKIIRYKNKNDSQLIGKTASEIFSPEMANYIYRRGREVLKNKKHFEEEFFCTRTRRWLDIDFYPATSGLTVYICDINEQKRNEERLKKIEFQFKRLIDSNIIGVAIEEISGKIVDANDVFLKIIGYRREELLKLNWKKLTSPVYRQNDAESMKTLFEKGEIFPYEKEYIRKDGRKIPVLKGGASLEKNPPTAVVFIIDISEQKKLEQRKDEFISMASHELKTPLTSVKAFSQLLQRHAGDIKDRKAMDYLSRMDNQLDRLTKLIVDLLDVTKIQEGKLLFSKETFDFDKLVEEIIGDIRIVSPNHKIIRTGASRMNVSADKFRISQLITNLLNNAIKYSHAGGKIRVVLSANNHNVILSVEDKGIGISKDNQTEIFNKFYRVDSPSNRSYPGLGLGLYISSEIIRRHHGKIWVNSQEGKGAIFSISLPATTRHE